MINRPHILVIDDNMAILDVFNMMLSRKYKTTVKQEVKSISATVGRLLPDLILLDWRLGVQNGCDYCSELKSKEQFRQIPIIMMSANNTSRRACLKAGAEEFIEKPFEIQFMMTRIAHYLLPLKDKISS